MRFASSTCCFVHSQLHAGVVLDLAISMHVTVLLYNEAAGVAFA